jgi:16S rRNA (uracil1498-N3)-methyltransferase
VPWAAARSVAVWRGDRAERSLARWRATAREAAKQARRAWFPEVSPLASTADVAALLADAPLALVLHEEATEALPADVPDRVVLLVGPEGGLSDEELAAFTAAGAHAVRLGAEVLRTSTAGLAACAALLSHTPRWR